MPTASWGRSELSRSVQVRVRGRSGEVVGGQRDQSLVLDLETDGPGQDHPRLVELTAGVVDLGPEVRLPGLGLDDLHACQLVGVDQPLGQLDELALEVEGQLPHPEALLGGHQVPVGEHGPVDRHRGGVGEGRQARLVVDVGGPLEGAGRLDPFAPGERQLHGEAEGRLVGVGDPLAAAVAVLGLALVAGAVARKGQVGGDHDAGAVGLAQPEVELAAVGLGDVRDAAERLQLLDVGSFRLPRRLGVGGDFRLEVEQILVAVRRDPFGLVDVSPGAGVLDEEVHQLDRRVELGVRDRRSVGRRRADGAAPVREALVVVGEVVVDRVPQHLAVAGRVPGVGCLLPQLLAPLLLRVTLGLGELLLGVLVLERAQEGEVERPRRLLENPLAESNILGAEPD